MARKKTTIWIRLMALAVGTAAGATALWASRNRRLFSVGDVTAGESTHYPELRAHVYFAGPSESIRAAIEALESLRGCRIVHVDDQNFRVLAEAESDLTGQVHEIAVMAQSLGPRHTRVPVRSRMAGGRGDLGENARLIRKFQDAMDQRLTGG